MKKILIIGCAILLLNACSTLHNISGNTENFASGTRIIKKTDKNYLPTNSKFITLSETPKLNASYVTVATVIISRYNLMGVKRQRGILDDLLQQDAATLGGNAVINIQLKKKSISGDVIRYI